MLKKLITIVTMLVSLAACKSKSNLALNYNQDFVAKDNSLQPEEQATEDNVTRYYNAGQYDSIAVAGKNMEAALQKAIDEISAIPVPQSKGGESFKAATIRYFNFFKSIYTRYKEYGYAGTDEKRTEIITVIQKLISQRPDIMDDMHSEQRKYADANGFRLEAK